MTNQLTLIQNDLASQLQSPKAILPAQRFTNAAAVALANNAEIMEMLERRTEMVWQRGEKDVTPETDRYNDDRGREWRVVGA